MVDAGELLERLRQRLGRIAPTSAVHWTSTMRDEFALEFAASRFYAFVVSAFALSALVLTGVGLFAAVSHIVARRTAEIGLRRALGGTRTDVARYVALLTLRPLSFGLIAGVLAALAVSRTMGAILYGITPFDMVGWVFQPQPRR